MAKDDEAASQQQLSLSAAWKGVGALERHVHPALYDSVLRVAEEKHVTPREIHHVMTAEEAFPFVAQGRCVALLTKSGALRIARGVMTIRPLMEEALMLRTYIAARADNKSKLVSEFLRSFIKKLSRFDTVKQLPLPISV